MYRIFTNIDQCRAFISLSTYPTVLGACTSFSFKDTDIVQTCQRSFANSFRKLVLALYDLHI